ncbi:MAG: galactokinase [Streptococcaceae bacterium]|jgi:galactokinase|nr:galactokinase [Streptococcaceae bacterium]
MVELAKTFIEKFGPGAEPKTYFSPGRINLIGEHTDYNGGHVFPAAITLGTSGVARPREDTLVRVYSLNFPDLDVIEFDVNETANRPELNWANYVLGMLVSLRKQGFQTPNGFELAIEGNIPNGSGLSSSASLEMLVGVVVRDFYNLSLSTLEMVLAGKATENNFIGVNSGIMDQFAIAFGQVDQGIFLDTNTLEYSMVPVVLTDYRIVIMNTKKRRELADSKYNERRSECEEALRRLQTQLDIQALGDLSTEVFEQHTDLIGDDTLIKRARHAVTENERTILAKEALTSGKLETFGQLLNASHASLKEDYEVTGIELDTLAETAQQQEGVIGARMTGAGFGGCGIAIVETDKVAAFKQAVYDNYLTVVGYEPEFYEATIGSGARGL